LYTKLVPESFVTSSVNKQRINCVPKILLRHKSQVISLQDAQLSHAE
jgi:hypothetical protein